jgi:nucleoside-diphosphate-sugar epimerase
MLHTNSNWSPQHLCFFRFFFWITLIVSTATATSAMSLRNVVITGANRGLGLELCQQLCSDERYQKIYALCRQTSPGLSDLAAQHQPSKIEIVGDMDVTAHETVGAKLQAFFRSDTADPIPIHLLIHNAGAYGPTEEAVKDYKDMYASHSHSSRRRFFRPSSCNRLYHQPIIEPAIETVDPIAPKKPIHLMAPPFLRHAILTSRVASVYPF